MELYKYDFAYIFTKIYNRTFYYICDTPEDGAFTIDYGTDAALAAGVDIIQPFSCIVEKSPKATKVYVAEPNINTSNRYLTKEDAQIIRKEIAMILQIAHIRQATDIVINVGSSLCSESIAHTIQMELREHSGVFRTITICCPNALTKTIYADVFNIMNRI